MTNRHVTNQNKRFMAIEDDKQTCNNHWWTICPSRSSTFKQQLWLFQCDDVRLKQNRKIRAAAVIWTCIIHAKHATTLVAPSMQHKVDCNYCTNSQQRTLHHRWHMRHWNHSNLAPIVARSLSCNVSPFLLRLVGGSTNSSVIMLLLLLLGSHGVHPVTDNGIPS